MCMGKWKQILNIFLYSMTFFHHICDENIKNEWRVDFIQARVEIIHQVSGNYPHVSGNYPKRVEKIEWNLSESSGFYPNRVEIIRIEWILSKVSGKNRVEIIRIEWNLSESSGFYPKWVEINFDRVEIIQSEWKLSKVSGRIILPDNSRDVPMEEIIAAARVANVHNFINQLPLVWLISNCCLIRQWFLSQFRDSNFFQRVTKRM